MAITTQWINIPATGGAAMPGYLAIPPSGRGPGIVLLQEIFGVNAAMRAVADDFAVNGYTVLVPDLFVRFKPGIELGYDDEDRRIALGYLAEYDFQQGIVDVQAAANALRERPEVSDGIASLGFCMGGKLAVLAAHAAVVDAAVSFYGVRLQENLAELGKMACPLMLHFGGNDSHVPKEVVDAVQEAVKDLGNVDTYLYPGAPHGFFNTFRPGIHDASASSLARSRTLEFLERTVGTF